MTPAEWGAKIKAAGEADRAANPEKYLILSARSRFAAAAEAGTVRGPGAVGGDRGGSGVGGSVQTDRASEDSYNRLTSYAISKGYIKQQKDSFLDKVVNTTIQAVTVAGIGGGLLGIAGVGPAAAGGGGTGGFSAAEIAAGSDAGFLPAPVAATPLVSPAASAATLGTGVVTTAKTLGVLAGTAASVASAANSFKNTKAASNVTPDTVPTVRPVWRPADAAVPDPLGDSGAGWLLLAAALFGGAVLIA